MTIAHPNPFVKMHGCAHTGGKPLKYAIYYGSGVSINTIKFIMAINSALSKPLNLSADLEAVVGKGPLPRTEVVKQLWVYIKKNNLQNPANKRNILADEKLKKLFGGKGEVTMFEMTKLVSAHMK